MHRAHMTHAINEDLTAGPLLQDAWMRRMAQALLRGTDGADDLAQDAWVVALQQRRASAKNQPWIAGVLRYRAWASKRASASRAYHEDRAVREGCRSTGEVAAEQLELRRRVAEELAALDEPCRSVVYLCVIEGRSLRRAAAELDVAPSTVQARLNDGLTRLRRRLDEAYAGERNAWAALALPWIGRAHVLKGLTLGGAAAALVAMGAATAWVVGSTAQQQGAGGPPEPLGEPTQLLAAPEAEAEAQPTGGPGTLAGPAGPRATRTAAATSTLPAEPTPVATTSSRLSVDRIIGRILQPDGLPASGGQWKLERRRGRRSDVEAYGEPPETQDIEGVLDQDGNLQIAFHPHPAQRYSLTVDLAPWAIAAWRWDAIDPDETVDLGTAWLRNTSRISGQLTNSDGGVLPPRSWSVQAKEQPSMSLGQQRPWSATTKSEPDGSFTIERVPLGSIQIAVSDREIGRTEAPPIEVGSGAPTQATVPVTIPASVMTSVSIEIARLIAPFVPMPTPEQVTLISESGERRSAEPYPGKPRFLRFRDVGPGNFRCEVDLPGARLWWKDDLTSGMTDWATVLGKSELRLNVVDPEGQLVTDMTVDLTRLDAPEPTEGHIVRGGSMLEGGRIFGLVPGDYRVRVHSGTLTGEVTTFGLEADEQRAITVVLANETGPSGIVTYPDGQPAPGVLVRMTTRASEDDTIQSFVADENTVTTVPERVRHLTSRTATDADGAFAFPVQTAAAGNGGTDPADFVILAGETPGPVAQWRSIDADAGDEGPIELQLFRAAELKGRIVLAEGVDTSLWQVAITASEGSRSESSVQSDGTFGFEALPGGLAHLKLRFRSPSNTVAHGPEPGPLHPYQLGSVTLRSGEVTEFVAEYPGSPLATVYFEVDGAQEGLRMVAQRTPLGPSVQGATSPHSPQPSQVGPLLLEPGSANVWASFDGGLAHWDDVRVLPDALDGTPQVIRLSTSMRTERLRVMAEGSPLSNVGIEFPGLPNYLHPGDFKTNDEGIVEIRLGGGSYKISPAWSSINDPLIGFAGSITAPLPAGEEDVVLAGR